MHSLKVITLLALLAAAFAASQAETDSRGCWTCAPGWVHWYDLGWSAPSNGDKCQCVQSIQTPKTATHNCWTCGPGWVHWYDLGWKAPSNGDKCQCVKQCWTCGAGWIHWYEAGMTKPSNGDYCECVPVSTQPTAAPAKTSTAAPTTKAPTTAPSTKAPTTSTTKAPTTSNAPTQRNCWTCAAGYKHWYELGMEQPADPCACISVTTPSAPTKAPTTSTKAPSSTSTKSPSTNAPATSTKAPASTSKPTTRLAQFIAAMTPTSSSTGSISFSPGIGSYSPSNPAPLSVVGTLMDNLIATTKYRTIMTYYIDEWTIGLAAQKGLKVLGIIYIVPGQDNSGLINTAINVAKKYPDTLIAISCGNEMAHNYGITQAVEAAAQQCTSMVKSAGVSQPVGIIDTYNSWCSRDEVNCNRPWTAVAQSLDWIGLNDYPFWDCAYSGKWPCNTPATAPNITLTKHRTIQSMYNLPTIITEFGWPAARDGESLKAPANVITGQQCGIANNANQKAMVQGMIDLYRREGMPCNTFSAYREPWKGDSDQSVDRYWGVCLGVAPYTCINAPK